MGPPPLQYSGAITKRRERASERAGGSDSDSDSDSDSGSGNRQTAPMRQRRRRRVLLLLYCWRVEGILMGVCSGSKWINYSRYSPLGFYIIISSIRITDERLHSAPTHSYQEFPGLSLASIIGISDTLPEVPDILYLLCILLYSR
jgi:hypothetical protein